MLFTNHIVTALRQLFKNKGRSILTMLGIIIGIGSVIFIMTLGEVAKNFLLSQISRFGTNVMEVSVQGSFGPFEGGDQPDLTEDDISTLLDSPLLPEIERVAGGHTVLKQVDIDGKKEDISIFADRPDFFPMNHIKVLKGRTFTKSEMQSLSRVIVLGEDSAKEIFGSTDVIGKEIKIGGIFFRIVGVVEGMDFGTGNFVPNRVYAPVTTVKDLFLDPSQQQTVSYLLIEFTPGTNTDSLKKRIDYELKKQHKIADKEEEVFLIISREQALGIFDSVLLGIQAFVSAVAGISLFVGGIGIMNIMLVTVKERTKEIGLRKAIGAKNSSILFQFLIEAVVLTTLGGIIGITFGLGLSFLAVTAVNAFQPDWDVTFLFVPQAVFIACGVSMTVGLIFGLYPALKASKLHPIEALRYE